MSGEPRRWSYEALAAEGAREIDRFRALAHAVPYERKGILYSEMFFFYLGAKAAGARRLLESGRARGQSTLLMSLLFPELQIISFEADRASPDVPVAAARLAGRANVDLRFGDATKVIPPLVREGDVLLVDGPKGMRGLRLALRCLATQRCPAVFVHDMTPGSAEREFADRYLPETLYSEDRRFARLAHALDRDCESAIPPERRFHPDGRGSYGFSLACILARPGVAYRRLLARAVWQGVRQKLAGGA
jgi:hypothetical protein